MVVTHRDWQMRASIALLVALVFVCVSAATMAAWWQWGPVDRPFEYVDHFRDRAEVSDDTVTIHRTLVVRNTVELHITRELVQRDGAGVRKIQLPESRAVYQRGEYNIARPIPLPPGVTPGVYEMHNVVHWRINPMREGTLALPPLRVVVE